MLNILHLKYLIAVVENDCNITQAAQELFVSQPALSKSISQMEKNANFLIFERYKGRLSHLTLDGKVIYDHAKKVISEYDNLVHMMEMRTKNEEGEVTLGIPPVVITTLFTKFLNSVKYKNERVNLKILEYGGHMLEEMIKDEKINFAILVDSNLENDPRFNRLDIHFGEFGLFMSAKHPLSNRDSLNWKDLDGMNLALVDETFSAHHLFQSYLKKYETKINSMITASSSDYLFACIKDSDVLTFLPMITQGLFNMKGIKAIPFTETVPWKITFYWRKKTAYTSAEKYLIDSFHSYFIE